MLRELNAVKAIFHSSFCCVKKMDLIIYHLKLQGMMSNCQGLARNVICYLVKFRFLLLGPPVEF